MPSPIPVTPLVLAAPFACGALLPLSVVDGPVLCPFRAMTGVPCPFCGSVRGFTLLMHGDGAWLQQNAFVVVVVGVALLVAVVLGVTGAQLRAPPGRVQVAGGLLLVACAWAWALANASTIAPHA